MAVAGVLMAIARGHLTEAVEPLAERALLGPVGGRRGRNDALVRGERLLGGGLKPQIGHNIGLQPRISIQ